MCQVQANNHSLLRVCFVDKLYTTHWVNICTCTCVNPHYLLVRVASPLLGQERSTFCSISFAHSTALCKQHQCCVQKVIVSKRTDNKGSVSRKDTWFVPVMHIADSGNCKSHTQSVVMNNTLCTIRVINYVTSTKTGREMLTILGILTFFWKPRLLHSSKWTNISYFRCDLRY